MNEKQKDEAIKQQLNHHQDEISDVVQKRINSTLQNLPDLPKHRLLNLSPKLKFILSGIALILLSLVTVYFMDFTEETNITETAPSELVITADDISSPSNLYYSFTEAIKESDAIAIVEIMEPLGETNTPAPKTFYNAEVKQIFKGKDYLEEKKITIQQLGNNHVAFSRVPPFQNGDEKLLFLKDHSKYPNTFWLLGEQGQYYEIEGSKVIKEVGFNDHLQDIQEGIRNMTLRYDIAGQITSVNLQQQIFNKRDFISFLQREIVKVTTAGKTITIEYSADNMDRGNHDYQSSVHGEIIIDGAYYNQNDIGRGDVIYYQMPEFQYDKNPYMNPPEKSISRIVGLTGEVIEIKDGKVYINGKILDTFYSMALVRGQDKKAYFKSIEDHNLVDIESMKSYFTQDMAAVKIPENHIFVLGDQWLRSIDSVLFGPLPVNSIYGKVLGYEE